MKGIQIGKKYEKLSLFADGMFLYVENPKDSRKTATLLELINDSWPKSTYKNLLQFNTLAMKETKKTISFITASKRMKYIGIILAKG